MYLTSGHVVCTVQVGAIVKGFDCRVVLLAIWWCLLSWEAIEAGCSCVTTHDTMKQTEVVAVRKFTSWQPTNCVWHLKHDITYACPDYTCREFLFSKSDFSQMTIWLTICRTLARDIASVRKPAHQRAEGGYSMIYLTRAFDRGPSRTPLTGEGGGTYNAPKATPKPMTAARLEMRHLKGLGETVLRHT